MAWKYHILKKKDDACMVVYTIMKILCVFAAHVILNWINITQKLLRNFNIFYFVLHYKTIIFVENTIIMKNRLAYLNKELGTSYKLLKEIDWYYISEYQKLSEDFIREFKDKVDWYYISQSQQLSEDFIREFKDKVNWNIYLFIKKLSEDFIRV